MAKALCRKKVLLVNQAFGYGGITTYAIELIKCLSLDHELTVVLPDDSVHPIAVPGVKVFKYNPMELSLKNALSFIQLINEVLKPDIVISSYGLIIPVIAPFLNNDIRVMTVSHSGRFFASEYSVLNHKYTDDIISLSDYNKHYLEKKYHIPLKSKIKVIYNFLSSDPALESLRSEKKRSSIVHIIYAGGSLPGKNPDLVLRILCKLLKTNLSFRFYWTGDTQLPLPKKFKRLFSVHDVRQYLPEDDRVVFTGKFESQDEFEKFVSSCNILLSPSRNEGCSMLLIQALRSGSICMVGDYTHGNREIVERGDCGFSLNHHCPELFVEKINEIINNPSDYSHLYDNAYNSYKEYLTYPVWKKAIEELMNSEPNHKQRKPFPDNNRLLYDIMRLRIMKGSDYYRRVLGFAFKSLSNFFLLHIRMKLMGDLPKMSMYNRQ